MIPKHQRCTNAHKIRRLIRFVKDCFYRTKQTDSPRGEKPYVWYSCKGVPFYIGQELWSDSCRLRGNSLLCNCKVYNKAIDKEICGKFAKLEETENDLRRLQMVKQP